MLNQLQKSKGLRKGFTIIEVLIVLAIAGLIILVVLLAVPALQRNARNTTLKSDATALAGAVGEYKSNNDGVRPNAIALSGTTATVSGTGTASSTAKLSGGATVTGTATPTAGNIGYVAGACPGSTANSRSFAIYYTPEASGTTTVKCIDS